MAAVAPLAAELGDALRSRLGATSSGPGTPVAGPSSAGMMDDPDYNRLWQALGHAPTGMDRLAERTGLPTAELSSILLVMALEGRIVVATGRYARKRQETATHAPQRSAPGKHLRDRKSVSES